MPFLQLQFNKNHHTCSNGKSSGCEGNHHCGGGLFCHWAMICWTVGCVRLAMRITTSLHWTSECCTSIFHSPCNTTAADRNDENSPTHDVAAKKSVDFVPSEVVVFWQFHKWSGRRISFLWDFVTWNNSATAAFTGQFSLNSLCGKIEFD